MKTTLRPANAKARALFKKLQALAEQGIDVRPYTVALSLGKQIRFSAPLEQITAELEAVTQKHLTQSGCQRES